MNENHIQQIFKQYIDNFEMLNDAEHDESFKWQVAKKFRPMMDAALNSSNEEFSSKLKEVRNSTYNLIDNYTQPFLGLVKFAEKNSQTSETVKEMFRKLFANSNAGIEEKQMAVSDFLKQSHELRDKYYIDSYLYKDDMHSVTSYLFLYDPDNNYIFKSSHALVFADCIEFYDDWGSGDSVKLDVYYRMCDWIASEIKKSPEILKTDASRFANGWGVDPQTFATDKEKHILVFDLIYCCSTYGLFSGIDFSRLKAKEKQLIVEKSEKARKLFEELKLAQANMQSLQEALAYLDMVFVAGANIQHKKYGSGLITNKDGNIIEVEFANGEKKKLGTSLLVANNIAELEVDEYPENVEKYKEILKKEST